MSEPERETHAALPDISGPWDRGMDRRWLAAALALAEHGLGRVAPNPSVAALIVRPTRWGGRLLGRGVTQPGGRPHAETRALAAAVERFGPDCTVGATAYVTLEPCAHHGLTPPCAASLVEAGIARVVCPLADPDPRVDGAGFAMLRAGGVEVETTLMAAEARRLNEGFLRRVVEGRPAVLLKLATTLDGRIATASGESRWITGPAARRRVHLMRLRADAVMIGAATARADDPMLDVRGFGAEAAQPVRIVLDPALTLSPASRLAATARSQGLWLLHRPGAEAPALEAAGARLVPCEADAAGRIPLGPALRRLGELGLTRILCEGGATLAAGLVAEGLVDELALFQAGSAIGAEGLPALGALGLGRLADAPRLTLATIERLGDDVLTTWRAAKDVP